ncbi:hypothetical protein Tco_0994341 [Tanacetum coccineum]
METEEISDIFVAPCFVNGLEAYDEEINLGVEENMISNEFAVKLCLEHEVKRRNKVVKKELIIALRGEIYLVKFIINPEEDDVEPGVVFGRSFLRLTKAFADFGNETVTIYPKPDPFLVSSEEEEKEERPVIETMTYSDKYKKILDEICLDKMKLDGMNKEEEEAIIRIKGEALIKKYDPGAFVILIRLEGKINLNALVDTGSDINVIPYRIYRELGREEVHNVKKGISMLNHSKAEPMGLLRNVLCHVGVTIIIAKFLILDMPVDRDTSILPRQAWILQKLTVMIKRSTRTKYMCLEKVASFLRSLPVALQHVECKPDYTGCFNKKEERDGQWHAEIRLTDPYGNIYDQGFVTKKTTKKLAKYHKLSDIMSPNWFQNSYTNTMFGIKE